jgi:Sec-independent protein secretion pathway component TatC
MPDDTPTCPKCGYDFTYDENNTTTSTKERWEYTGTILALVSVFSLPIIVLLAGLGIVSLTAISQGWLLLYSTVVLMATTWTYGKETLEAVRQARSSE